jgi:hypothetical protein
MIIKTRKLPATQTDGERMRATADTGASLTLPMEYSWNDPSERVAKALARAMCNRPHYVIRLGDNRWEIGQSQEDKES